MKVSFFCNYFLLAKDVVLPIPGSRSFLNKKRCVGGDASGMEGSLYVKEKDLKKSGSPGCPWKAL